MLTLEHKRIGYTHLHTVAVFYEQCIHVRVALYIIIGQWIWMNTCHLCDIWKGYLILCRMYKNLHVPLIEERVCRRASHVHT